MTFFTLACGSNYEGTRAQLRGCLVDVATVATLHASLGHQVETLKGLEASRQAIMDRLDAAYDQAGPDDGVWFFWSGHGTQVRDQDADEHDPWDEAICPDDSVRRGGPMLTDDDLYRKAFVAHAHGVRVIHQLDSCFSGTFHRALSLTDDQGVEVGVRFLPPAFHLPTDERARAALAWDAQASRSRVATGALALSACRDTQLAQEYPVDGKVQGAATYHSTKALAELLAAGEPVSYRDWWRATAARVNDPDQVPVLGGTASQKRWIVGAERGSR